MMWQKASLRGIIEGFKVGRMEEVTHLQYADDTILFTSTKEDSYSL